jgi:NodT family efflux transporter outer membrane factor (OMF) lipoprotein
VSNQYSLTGSVSWELDVWGRVRRSVESSEASAAASLADLGATRLSAQAALAQTYLQLRVRDEQKRLLDATVAAYEKSLQLTQNRYEVGVAGQADVAVARTQVESTRAQSIDLDWQRGQYEHAIAVLMGQAPSQFALPPKVFGLKLPQIPVGLPSELLERRPDVAAAERRAAAANAQIGVAQAAWFPSLMLSADGGFRNGEFAELLTAPARFWSLGPALALTIFDGGAREAQVEQARASYDAQAAAYRQAALTGLREVEDYLIQLRVMEQEQIVQRRALESARESLRLIQNQYKAGLVDYLSVAVVDATALNSERNAISLLGNRLVASVNLIVALGGGWDGLPPAETARAD